MDFKIIWSDAALADLQDIWAYVAQHDPQAADRIGRGILAHVRILASFPFIGPASSRDSSSISSARSSSPRTSRLKRTALAFRDSSWLRVRSFITFLRYKIAAGRIYPRRSDLIRSH
jgi:plasmid stabilization system protein ParE